MTPYRFPRGARKVVASVIDTIKPRWSDWDPPIDAVVLQTLERDLAYFPALPRFLVRLSLIWLQWGGLCLLQFPVRFTSMDLAGRTKRFHRLFHVRPQLLHLLVKIIKTHVLFICYTQPEVEAKLGVPRRAWIEDRKAFRRELLEADRARAELPPTPQPLGTPTVDPGHYLDLGATSLGRSDRDRRAS
jgi:hypothetical protein